jgi:hypothetical protein
MVECLPTCMDKNRPAKYQPVRWNDYMLMRASVMYEDKSETGMLHPKEQLLA